MLLQSKAFAQEEMRQRIHALFADEGIDPARIVLCGGIRHHELLEKYNEVDIAFDPFPYSRRNNHLRGAVDGSTRDCHAGMCGNSTTYY